MNPILFCSVPGGMKKEFAPSSSSTESISILCLQLHGFPLCLIQARLVYQWEFA